jgi:hypothetical protein
VAEEQRKPLEPDFTRCEHRFYFSDKEEWSSWSESFEPGEVSTEIESAKAEVEVRNVVPLFSAETIIGVDPEQLEDLGIDPQQFVREELPQWIPSIIQAIIEDRCSPENCELTEDEHANAKMCEKHLEQVEKLKEVTNQ